jgi:hypothetical protein
MKFLVLFILLFSVNAFSQTGLRSPSFVANLHSTVTSGGVSSNFPSGPSTLQHVAGSQAYGQAILNNDVYTLSLPEYTQGGNTLIVGCMGGLNSIVLGLGFKENPGQKWIAAVTNNDSGHVESIVAYIATNITAGSRTLLITNKSGSTLQYFTFVATEVCNIKNAAPIDVVSGTNFTGAVAICPGITPSVTGDFIWHFTACDDGTGIVGYMAATNQANFDQHFLSTDLNDFSSVQCGVYSSTTKFSPTVVNEKSASQISVCIALRGTNNQGSYRIASRPYIAAIHHVSTASVGNSFAAPETTLTNHTQFPVYGNLVVVASMSAGNMYITNMTTQSGLSFVRDALGGNRLNTNSEVSSFFYALNAAPSASNTVILTNQYFNVTNGAVGADGTLVIYDVVNAGTLTYDTGTTNAGDQTVGTGNLSQPGSVTPSVAGGIGFVEENHEFNTATNFSAAGLYFDAHFFDGENIDGPQNIDQNGGWGHFWPTNTSAISFTWQFRNTSALRTYAAHSIIFKP